MKLNLFIGQLVFFFAVSVISVYSCECAKTTRSKEFNRSKAVFVGEYMGSETGKAQFLVKKSWKGIKAGETLSMIYIDLEGCDYDLNPVKGEQYLIYAVSTDRGLFISVDCGRSRAIIDAKKDLKKMGKPLTNRQSVLKTTLFATKLTK